MPDTSTALESKRTPETHKLAPPESRGKTFIADEVVSIIARHAAEGIDGIHRIGQSSFRSLFSRMGRHHGVESEVGMQEAAVDLEITVEFGYPIRELAGALRAHVIDAVEQMTGRRVVEVNISVMDVHLEGRETSKRRELA
jgi:uncharacterized alkaline shock family protein YloU